MEAILKLVRDYSSYSLTAELKVLESSDLHAMQTFVFSILKLLYFPLSVTISLFLRNICLRGPVIECKLIKQL